LTRSLYCGDDSAMELITSHGNADFDSFAAMLAAGKLYPEAKMVFSGSKETALTAFLDNPYYDFDEIRLKDINPEEVSRLILVDVSHSSRLGPIAYLPHRKGVEVIIYDHHPAMESDIKARRRYVRPYGAITTLFVRILRRRKIPISKMEATIMAMGIYEDTGFLTYRTTTSEDVRQAAYLLDSGADLSLISNFLKRELTTEQLSLLNELISNADKHFVNGVPVVISQAERESFINDAAAVIQKQVDLQRYLVYIAVMRMGDKIHVIGRSRHHRVDIGKVVTELGGGGHATAASAVISGKTRVQVIELILDKMQELVDPTITAADIMNPNPHVLEPDTRISAARTRIVDLNINSFPIKEGDTVIGLVTRQLLDRAAAHRLRGTVREVMNSDLSLIRPEASVEEVEEQLMEGTQRCLLVGTDPSNVEGIITRMDLFRRIYVERRDARERDHIELVKPMRGHNIDEMLRKRLDARVITALKLASVVAESLDEKVYLVGGIVRDLIMNYPNKDVDLVVEDDGITFAKSLAEKSGGYTRSHERFGTAVVIFPDDFRLDVATARSESYSSPGALPQVSTGSLRADLYRRDFTINALAVSLLPKEFGRLIDYFGGLRDIRNKKIRVMHGLSFIDDPTRALRAIRFANRFAFDITEGTKQLLIGAMERHMLKRISGKRLHTEFRLIFEDPRPLHAVELLEYYGVLREIHQKIKLDRFTANLIRKIDATLSWFRLAYISGNPNPVLMIYMALFEKLTTAERRRVCKRLQLNPQITEVLTSFKQHMRKTLELFQSQDHPPPSTITDNFEILPLETVLFIHSFANREPVRLAVVNYLTSYHKVSPSLRGADLIKLGCEPGPNFSVILRRLRNARLDGDISSRADEISLVKKEFLDSGPQEK